MRRPHGDSLLSPLPAGSVSARTSPSRALTRLILTALAALLATNASVQAQLPEASYWRTRVFFIPYQPTENAPFASPVEKVQLLVSRGGDAQWAVLQEAEPRVRGFSYHAPVDGEYAFAVRTINRKGEAQPSTISQPQLRVVVDTLPPTLAVTATPDGTGRLFVRYEGRDQQLKPESVRLEAQSDGVTWQRISTGPPDVSHPDRVVGQVAWKPPANAAGVKFRATIDDRAGNQFSAIADASLLNPLSPMAPTLAGPALTSPASAGPAPWGPALGAASGSALALEADPFAQQPQAPSANAASPNGYVSGGAPLFAAPPAAQEWTAAPSPANQPLNSPPAFPATNGPFAAANAASPPQPAPPLWPHDRTPARLVAENGGMQNNFGAGPLPPSDPFAAPPLVSANNIASNSSAPGHYHSPFPLGASASATTPTPVGQSPIPTLPSWATPSSAPPNEPPVDASGTRWVNSLTFDVDYDLQTVGPWGVSKVELYATRDGGAQWASFGPDADNRSPMRVTVPAAGVYGFRLVVNGANGTPAPTPQAGDQPELVIGVDLAEPQAELQAAEIGQGNLADHLIIRWSAADENLDARPVGLFYANNAEGPWSTVATDIDNNGQYAWRLLQQVPERLFLRLEVRDKAGNVTVRQSSSPVALNLPQPTGTLRSVRPVQGEPQRFRTAAGHEIRNQ